MSMKSIHEEVAIKNKKTAEETVKLKKEKKEAEEEAKKKNEEAESIAQESVRDHENFIADRDASLDEVEQTVSARVKMLKQRPGAQGKMRGSITVDGKINYLLVYEMGKLGCTHEELASLLGYTRQNVDLLVKNDDSFSEAFSSGKSIGKTSIRRLQRREAEKGHVTMLIWLGKQLLNQRDKQEVVTHDFDPTKFTSQELDELIKSGSS